MSDDNIRRGLRDLQSVGPEYASQLLGQQKIKELVEFFSSARRFEEHTSGQCRHCYPVLFKDEEPISNAIITSSGAVLSSCCRVGGIGHNWCANRNWTECHCSCECHCFVKRFYSSERKLQ